MMNSANVSADHVKDESARPSAMRILKRRHAPAAKISLVLLDWGVRESFHLLHYLRQQTVSRNDIETILVEYTETPSAKAAPFLDQVDTYILMGVDRSYELSKHSMYNVGLLASQGRVVVFCDSDAMVKPSFIETIIRAFPEDDRSANGGARGRVFHIDQFRNTDRRFYPFNYPKFEEIEGPGCINHRDAKTTGIADPTDTLHSRNYGACMCALRGDLLSIGGADEHVSFLGHICGPYDMTFRLVNTGRREVWSETEFMYHTWHPGEGGSLDHYIGPNLGYVATTTIEALLSGRVMPLVENVEIARLRESERLTPLSNAELEAALARLSTTESLHDRQTLPVLRANLEQWPMPQAYATTLPPHRAPAAQRTLDGTFRAWRIYRESDRYAAEPLFPDLQPECAAVEAATRGDLIHRLRRIDARTSSPGFSAAYRLAVALAIAVRIPVVLPALAKRVIVKAATRLSNLRGNGRSASAGRRDVASAGAPPPCGPATLPPGARERRPRSRRKWLVLRAVQLVALGLVAIFRSPSIAGQVGRRIVATLRRKTRRAEARAGRWLRLHEGSADLVYALHALSRTRDRRHTHVISSSPIERMVLGRLSKARVLPPMTIWNPRNLEEVQAALDRIAQDDLAGHVVVRSSALLRYWSEFERIRRDDRVTVV
jgi:Glycosyl transferase family 2